MLHIEPSFPSKMYIKQTRTTIEVTNGRYTFYQIHYQTQFIKYHLSNTFYPIPFIKHHLSNTIYQMAFIKILFIKYPLKTFWTWFWLPLKYHLNRQKVKISYSCMPNVYRNISSINQALINPENNLQLKSCNCQAKILYRDKDKSMNRRSELHSKCFHYEKHRLDRWIT